MIVVQVPHRMERQATTAVAGVRGGAWSYVPRARRATVRYWHAIGYRDNYLGFRAARVLAP